MFARAMIQQVMSGWMVSASVDKSLATEGTGIVKYFQSGECEARHLSDMSSTSNLLDRVSWVYGLFIKKSRSNAKVSIRNLHSYLHRYTV